ncbi:uncharacterized protein BJ171DRAFT_505526 [Polychytrium aggregatum]|uniref:uncharacterized protein n=1 Tax=Polychytrium aggregatum TaxID=110093 RepID=UPI0022FE3EA4|nr:uncharacterized protein BJ171DRAFT_505526 [Polychytrium aggregatum]KAI9204338.1 hypothetical protein BJ171DRAFT_505526 [Polychytrium aggregatum]
MAARDTLQALAFQRSSVADISLLPSIPDQAIATYDPLEVLASAQALLKSGSGLSEAERLNLHEQICIAALDSGNLALAETHRDIIFRKFDPKTSIRAQKLSAYIYESTGNFEQALKTYEAILEADETYVAAHKRIAALAKAQNQNQNAIKSLIQYLDTFSADVEAWVELAALYTVEGMFQQAGFCYEELIVLRPDNIMFHLRYADVLYTLQRYDVSLKYYCAALELCRDTVRALYGIRLASDQILASNKSPEPKIRALNQLAKERLAALYQDRAKSTPKVVSVVKSWLAQE